MDTLTSLRPPAHLAEEPSDASSALVRSEQDQAGVALSGFNNPAVAGIPIELDVAVPVRGFRLRSILTLEPGTLIESSWDHTDDVPLNAGGVRLAWCEFEVVDSQLAVRLARLA